MNFEDLADIIKYPMEKLNGFITCQEQIGCMYRDFTIFKKDGRLRKISEPYFELKLLQRQVYKNMLAAENLHEACFGFRSGRNIKDKLYVRYAVPAASDAVGDCRINLPQASPTIGHRAHYWHQGGLSEENHRLCHRPAGAFVRS